MYNFPDSPAENDEFATTEGQTYIYKSPRWLVKGIPPTGGGGGGGIAEAPVDGKQYAREDAAWSEVVIPAGTWDSITGKPATFPPTVPIDWADITGQPATYPPTLPIPWGGITGQPSTFPPQAHTHPESEVINLTTDLAAKAPLASPTFTGDPKAPTPATADNDTSIATTAHVQANMALKANLSHTHAQADITNLVSDLALKAPLASPAFTGSPTTTVPSPGDSTSRIATTSFVMTEVASGVAGKANIASPTFTGNPAAPTPTAGDNDTSIATTAFVVTAIANAITAFRSAMISDTAPAGPVHGQLWWNSTSANLYIYYNDGDSSQWVQVNTVGS